VSKSERGWEFARSNRLLTRRRVFRERFDNPAEYEAVKDLYIIDNDVLARAKPSTIVMHPLPRNNEIDPEVDFDSRRAAYFRQMRYGLFVSRPAMLP
jgi:carbamoyl-phosphate synthase/aspartate carbamoyltransferase